MVLAAGLMVLVGVGLFVGGVLTGVDTLYWACVVACLVAAGLLLGARRHIAADTGPPPEATTPAGGRSGAAAFPRGSRAAGALADRSADGADGEAAERTPASGPPASTREPAHRSPAQELADPPVEEVEVTDLLLVVDLKDDVFVIDEHPRYHVAECAHLRGRTSIPLPMDEARIDGFTPCAVCAPDRTMAERVRARRAAGSD